MAGEYQIYLEQEWATVSQSFCFLKHSEKAPGLPGQTSIMGIFDLLKCWCLPCWYARKDAEGPVEMIVGCQQLESIKATVIHSTL